MSNALPSGMVTFCFTDIEGSTQLFAKLGPKFLDLLDDHRRIIRDVVREHGGAEVKTEGDGFFLAFGDPAKAVAACVDFQRTLAQHPWPDGASIKVRAGLHVGLAEPSENDYMTYEVHEAARISSAPHGGQTVLSDAIRGLVSRSLPEEVTLRDLGIHELKDVGGVRLHQVCHPALDDDFPPLRTVGATRGYVPAQTSSLIGRTDDLADLLVQVRSSRVVSVTGAGGVGKTRLAVEAARAELGKRPDGVWFVDLAPVTDEAWIDDSMLSAMGVVVDPDQVPRPQLIDFLRNRSMLVVLDNCEHLIDGCTQLVANVSHACPDVAFLTTSREALGLPGEVAWRARSLEVDEALELFVQRAKAARADFDPTGVSDRIRDIVERLDGIPLAIELAAARISVLTVQQIADRLDDRFRLLTGGTRSAMARQRTLEATVDWSYQLLEDAERALLRRLAVFSGSFDLEAAEAVGGADVLDLLQRLVDKSMVTTMLAGDTVRYRMLETIRAYAWQKLLDADAAVEARDAHLRHYADVVERLSPGLNDAREVAVATALSLDHDNVRAALDWSIAGERLNLALRLAADLWMFWSVVGRTSEGLTWMDRILPVTQDGDPELVAKAHVGMAHLIWIAQRPASELRKHAEVADAHARKRGSSRWYDAWASMLLGTAEQDIGGFHRQLIDEAVARARECGHGFVLAHCLLAEARMVQSERFDTATALFDEALEVARACGSVSTVGEVLNAKSASAIWIGDPNEAVRLAHEAIGAARRGPNVYFQVFSLLTLGRAKVVRSDDDANEQFMQALELARDHGLELQVALAQRELAWLDLKRRATRDAASRLEEAIEIAERLAPNRLTMFFLAALARAGRAEVAAREGRLADARALFEPEIAMAEASGSPGLVALARSARGWLAQLEGDLQAAEAHHRTAFEVLPAPLHPNRRGGFAAAVRGIATVAFARGEVELAVRSSGAVRDIREPNTGALGLGTILHEEMLEAACDELGIERYDALWNDGVALGLDGVRELLTLA